MMKTARVILMITLCGILVCSVSCRNSGPVQTKIEWGEAWKGLQIGIQVDRNMTADPTVVLFAQNVNNEAIDIWQCGIWPNTTIQCLNRNGKSAQPTVEGQRLLRLFKPGGERSKNYLLRLARKEVHEIARIDLLSVYHLQPTETYSVRAIYEEHMEIGWSGAVTSNFARVQLRKP